MRTTPNGTKCQRKIKNEFNGKAYAVLSLNIVIGIENMELSYISYTARLNAEERQFVKSLHNLIDK